jgi:hypothetical protein
MLLTILFWVLILLDLAALGLVFLLGLAAGPSSHTGPLAIAGFLLVVPGICLLAAVALFHFTKSKLLRGLAFLAAAAPLLIAVLAPIYATYNVNQYKDPSGHATRFKPGPLQDIEAAIKRNDPAAVAALAPKANLKETAIDGASVLTVALRASASPEILRALLAAGADPNAEQLERPLTAALLTSRNSGVEPLRVLLESGANPNLRDSFGQPLWFLATGAGVPPDALPLLLEKGADLNALDSQRHNALFPAVNSQNWGAARLLIERGIDWKSYRDLRGLDLPTRLAADARLDFIKKEGLPELIALLR